MPPNSASVADDMTHLIMCAMLSTAPLFCGTTVSPGKKKCPTSLLLHVGSLRWLALLCTAGIMSLALYVNSAYSCVAM